MKTYAQQREQQTSQVPRQAVEATIGSDQEPMGSGPQQAPVSSARPTLRRGSTGGSVLYLQQELGNAGYTIDADGIFGGQTEGVVRRFQADRNLDADGIVGPRSWAALSPVLDEPTLLGVEIGSQSQDSGPGPDTSGPDTSGPATGPTGPITVDDYMANLASLPRGSAMSPAQRAQMYELTASMSIAQIRVCFEHRFNQPLEDTTGAWTPALARAVWQQLETLPDGHVADNTILTAYQAISGGGGFGPSWEAPTVLSTIQLGEDNQPAAMGHTVRHEVGHAVHADSSYMGTINAWLQNDVGFWFFPNGQAGLRTWVEELGGFGAASAEQQETFLAQLSAFVGGGASWAPARPTFGEGLPAQDASVYEALPAAVRDGIAQSTPYWYNNYRNFASGARGRYFLNYWYARGFYMGPAAEACVAATGSTYTAMSEKEFFADCYAEFFKDPAGFADSSRWGGNLPSAVKAFFRSHILDQQPYTPPAPTLANDQVTPPPKPTGMPGTP